MAGMSPGVHTASQGGNPGVLGSWGCSCALCAVWSLGDELEKPPLPCWCCAWPRAGFVPFVSSTPCSVG